MWEARTGSAPLQCLVQHTVMKHATNDTVWKKLSNRLSTAATAALLPLE